MGFKDNTLYQKIERFFIGHADDRKINVEAVSRSAGTNSITGQLQHTATTLQEQTLKEWKLAILLATDPEESSRDALKKLYFNLELDSHLMATVSNRIEAVQGAPFKIVDKNGGEDPEKTNLLKKQWFIDFMRIALMSNYTGTKVIELYQIKEDGNLQEVTEVDMAHVIPQKGLIVKEPGDTKGWNYKDGAFADYYIQVGDDDNLGLFAMLAPIVLAKKLGIGSWLDYVEKYGIPPMFVITDREDNKRLEELYNSMLGFKGSHFGILRGKETVEFGTTAQAGNSTIFKDLIKIANEEISKRINGATGTTDEKTHVGAAQVHQDILNTKIKLDKFFIEVLVNEELIPRLIKLSPLYSGLDNFTFIWDESESLSLPEYLDSLSDLSANYQFDIEEVKAKTGLPIIAQKQADNTPAIPTKGQKKKP